MGECKGLYIMYTLYYRVRDGGSLKVHIICTLYITVLEMGECKFLYNMYTLYYSVRDGGV